MSAAPFLAVKNPEETSSQLSKVVVVGGGMAAYGLCNRLVGRGLHKRFQVVVIGEEPRPAYDRVNLSKIFSGRTADDLALAPKEWYSNHGLDLKTARRVIRIDRGERIVMCNDGYQQPYDKLVLATGSYPWVPPIPGTDLPGVFVYRTIEDLERIRAFVENRKCKTSAILGGGLLGLEAAKVMLDLGVDASVIEMAPGLMPRQLDARAARVLRRRVEALGVNVHVTRRTEAIEQTNANPNDGLTIRFANADPIRVDLLVVAAGIRPRDEIAQSADLDVGKRGGFAINRRLQTSDPNIYAIGECASFEDYTYGLVAPCYRMADILADRLAGEESEFRGADESAELKLLGVPVVALGRPIGLSTGGVVVTNDDANGVRRIILEQGRVAGAAGVGEWSDLDMVRVAVNKQQRIWPHQRRRFAKTGRLYAAGVSLPVNQWPADATVCACLGIKREALSAAIDGGAADVDALVVKTGASTACGSCRRLVEEIAGETGDAQANSWLSITLVASSLALVLSVLIFVLPPIPFATSVQDAWRKIDFLWRNNVAKQITGYSLLALALLGLLFTAKKRTKLLRWASYGFWRTFHIVLGLGTLCAIIVHTGLRMGANLNFALSLTFLAVAFVGALTGIASSLESRLSGEKAMFVRAWRPRLTRWHIWLFWPLPLLIAAHIVCVYLY